MITKGERLPSRVGAKTTAGHVFRGTQNEQITVLRGSEQDLFDWVRDARKRRKQYAVRHWKLSPEADISPEQELAALHLFAEEFRFDPERVVLLRHRKKRHNGAASEFHLHLLVPEVNAATGRVMSTTWDYARHEKLSRKLELAWGHDLVHGRFNAPVAHALEGEGRDLDAALVGGLARVGTTRPESQYPPGLDQEVRRKARRTMAQVRDSVLDARALSGGDADEFHRILEREGLRVAAGDKASRWVIEAQGPDGSWAFAGALHRLAGMKAAEADGWILGTAPVQAQPTNMRRKYDDKPHDRNHEGPTDGQPLDGGGNGGTSGRDEAARGFEAARPTRNDAILRSELGSSGAYQEADGAAGRRGAGAWSERAGRHQGTAGNAGAPASSHSREARRARPSHQPQDGETRSGPGEGRGGSTAPSAASSHASEADSLLRERSVRGLNDLVAAASMHHGFQRYRDDVRRWKEVTKPRPIGSSFGSRRVVRAACTDAERAERQRRFRLLMLRQAYPLSVWLPPQAVLFLSRVDYDPASARLVLTLTSGTKILDTGDRVLVQGYPDEIAVAEMAACVGRRGWSSVVIEGTPEFRREMARELIMRGIEVEDCPLSPEEVAEITDRVSARDMALEPNQSVGMRYGAGALA